MKREDIEQWTREAGGFDATPEFLAKFAAIVASASVRETSAEYRMGWNDGQIAEREVIAQMIEDAPALMDFAKNDKGGCLMCGFTPEIAAQSIRGKWGRHE